MSVPPSKDFAPQAKPPSLKSFLSLLEGGVTWSGLQRAGWPAGPSLEARQLSAGRTHLSPPCSRPRAAPRSHAAGRLSPAGSAARGPSSLCAWPSVRGRSGFVLGEGTEACVDADLALPEHPRCRGVGDGQGGACGARALPVPFPWAVCPCSGPLVGVWVQGHQCRADVKTSQSITQRPRSAWFRGAGGAAFISIAMPFQ